MHKLTITGIKAVVLSGLIILTTACQAPPLFTSPVSEVALDGNNVDITVNVSGNPSSVSCMNDAVTLQAGEGTSFSGTIPQYLLSVGNNIIHCSATNENGTISLPVGVVVVIPNIAPSINTIADISVYDNNGTVAVNINTLANGGTNMLAVTYRLATANGYDSLPAGLTLNAETGRITGSVDVDGTQSYVLAITATNLAGSDSSNPFTLTINDGLQ